MNDVVPAEVREFQRRLSAPSPDKATWAHLLPSQLPPQGLSMDSHSPQDSGSESETEVPHGLSPVSSASSLTMEADTPPRFAPQWPPATQHAVAIFCTFVGGGLQGCVDLCASVTLVDACGHVLLDTVVKPSLPVTDYRTASTGLTAEVVNKGMPFRKARKIVLSFLRASPSSPPRLDCHSKKQVILVGVNLQRALNGLMLDLPPSCLRELECTEATSVSAHRQPVETASCLLKQYLESQ